MKFFLYQNYLYFNKLINIQLIPIIPINIQKMFEYMF